ncbi:MAG: HpcH/HpaI aldolase family protein [Chloroflexota bacterium]
MRKNLIKEKIQAGQPVIGPIMGFNAPILVEMFAYAGFDFVVLDAEHGPLSVESCENLVRTAEAAGIPSIVRCPLNIPQDILRYIDTGTMGLHIPQINTAQDALTAVRSVKFHPMGQRGLAGTRAHGYGVAGPLSEQVKISNQESMIIAHIENIQAVHNLAELLAVDGIDIYFIGTSDLSHSMGIPAQYDHPELVATVDKAMKQITAAGKRVGNIARNSDEVKKYVAKGSSYVIVGAAGLIMSGAKSFIQKAREA